MPVLAPTPAMFGGVTALVFAAQMVNYPLAGGVSGHLLGGVLAASLLGTPFAVMAMALVVGLQALLFGDGGVAVLGANLLNMAVLGAGGGGLLRDLLVRRWGPSRQGAALVAASAASVLLASGAVAVELVLSGAARTSEIVPAVLTAHLGVAVAEGGITWLLVAALTGSRAVLVAGAVAVALSPLASAAPDALEHVVARFGLTSGAMASGPLADYLMPGLGSGQLSTLVAGGIGYAAAFALALSVVRLLGQARASA
jgi:cobalt/nickel transport system permease protein